MSYISKYPLVYVLIYYFIHFSFYASADNLSQAVDSLEYELDELEVVGSVPAAVHTTPGTIRYTPTALKMLQRCMGEIDLLNTLKNSAGINSQGDYGSGLLVDGAEASQSIYTISSVPVLFPYRFGGIFSTFNNSHFQSAFFQRNIHDASMPSRLGAKLNFLPYREIEEFGAYVNIGMLASSATLKIPVTSKLNVLLSGRMSYIDQLYSNVFNTHDTHIYYDFSDLNLTVNYNIDGQNCISVDLMYSDDNIDYRDSNYAMRTILGWNNSMAGLTWERKVAKYTTRMHLFYSGFESKLCMKMPQMGIALDSDTKLFGLTGDMSMSIENKILKNISIGCELQGFGISPAEKYVYGYGDEDVNDKGSKDNPIDWRIFADFFLQCSRSFTAKVGVSGSVYHNSPREKNYTAINLEPRASITYTCGNHTATLHSGLYHQPLHQVGFSDVGLASDFWMASGNEVPVQKSVNFAADYAFYMNGFRFGAEIYYKRVFSQPEYQGQLIDLLDKDYYPGDYVVESSGYNTGFNIELSKDYGALTGAVSYGFGAARRKYGDSREYIRGLTDMGHSFKVACDYRLDYNWNFGAKFVYSTGKPYTPVIAIYTIAGNLVDVLGERNSARYPAYHRLDISATYRFDFRIGRHKIGNFINFSFLNVYGRKNVEIQTFAINSEDGTYGLKRVSSMYRFVPSLSYTVEF